MATGVIAAGPKGAAPGTSSTMLSGASLPAVTTSSCALVGAGSAGAKGAYSAPRMSVSTVAGAAAPCLDGQWFDRIHILPREVALGNLTNDRTIDIEVFNAFRRGYKLWDVAIAGNSGVELVSVSTPMEFGPLHSEIQTVLVAAGGSDEIDNVLTWQWKRRTGVSTYALLSTPGADLTLSGTRMLIFAARPNGAAGVRERFGYLTDVMQAWDATEQRVQQRETPVRELRFSPLFVEASDALEVMAQLYLAGVSVFAVPFWPDATPATAAVASGASLVYADTAGREFEAGGNAILWRDQHTFEAFAILSVEADHLVVDGVIAGNFAAGTQCAPLLPMRALEAPPLNRLSGPVANLEVTFTQEGA